MQNKLHRHLCMSRKKAHLDLGLCRSSRSDTSALRHPVQQAMAGPGLAEALRSVALGPALCWCGGEASDLLSLDPFQGDSEHESMLSTILSHNLLGLCHLCS